MASLYYENSEDEPVWLVTSMSRDGAWVLGKRYREKMGCRILSEPMEREDTVWVIMISNPWMSVPEDA